MNDLEETTLKWLLEESPLHELECICCSDLLKTPVSGVSILENPDSVRWIRKNELVLCTGYVFKDSEDLQGKILQNLKQSGCAALCIKIKSYFNTIPEAMVREANKLELPIITIPYFYILRDVVACVNLRLESEKLRLEAYIFDEVHNISDIFFKNQELPAMLKYLSKYYNGVVMITTLNFQAVAAYIPEDCTELFPCDVKEIYYYPVGTKENIRVSGEERKYYDFKIRSRVVKFFAMPLPNENYYLCIDTGSAPIDRVHESILEKISPFLVLEIQHLNSQQFKLNNPDYYASFFSLLFNESARSRKEMQIICDLYSFNPKLKRVCITIQLEDDSPGDSESIKSLLEDTNKFISSDFSYFYCFRSTFISIFRFFPANQQSLDAITESYVHSKLLFAELSPKYRIRIGVSRAYAGIDTIATSFEESFRSIELQRKLSLPCQASSFWEQSIYHMLNQQGMNHFYQLYCDIIKPLIDYDKENGTNFLSTLKIYFQNTFNISKTAEDLFIHRNTLNYRLHQIKELLRFDFDFDNNINALFSLYLAICCYELSSAKES